MKVLHIIGIVMFICQPLQHCSLAEAKRRLESRETCLLLFLLQHNKSGRPIFIALQHRAQEKQSRGSFELGRTHFFLSRGARSQRQSTSHERKKRIMSDGSLLFPEEGELLYANPQNWLRPLLFLDTEPNNYHFLHVRQMSYCALWLETPCCSGARFCKAQMVYARVDSARL